MKPHAREPMQQWGQDYNCILPDTIQIQLKNPNHENLALDLIYCSIYITIVDHEDCFVRHLIPTDVNGKFLLTKYDLIYNTGLQFFYNANLPIDKSQVEFQIMLTPVDFIQYFARYTGKEFGEKSKRKFESPLNWHSARAKFHEEMYDEIWPDILKNRNLLLPYDSEKGLITGFWNTAENRTYDLVIHC